MASTRELKALITLAGRIDPSLQKSLLEASNRTKGLNAQMGLGQLAAQKAKGAWGQAQKGLEGLVETASSKMPIVSNLSEAASKSQLLQAGLVSLGNLGVGALKLVEKAARATAVAVGTLAAAGLAAFVALGKKGYKTAEDLVEVQNVVDVTFGDGAKKIDAWSQSLRRGYGLSELSAKRYSSTLGAMLKSSGVVGDDMMAMSQNLTMLAADMASFYNLQPDEMFEKIQSGISGQIQPLRQLGINMTVASLEAYALSQGITTGYSSLSQAEQMMLRYNYLLHATADSQGDFARNIDSAANQQKLFTEGLSEFSGRVMQNVLPAAVKLLQGVNGFMDSMDADHLGQFAAQMADLAVQVMPLALELLPVISDVVMTILPPLLEIVRLVLPPLTKFLRLVADVLGAVLKGGTGAITKLIGLFSGKGKSSGGGGGLEGFARGGFSSRPAIFGEAGLEAAIPIRPRNPRSLALLQRTAELLGVGSLFGGGTVINYHPTIEGGSPDEVRRVLASHSEDLRRMLDELKNRDRRLAFS